MFGQKLMLRHRCASTAFMWIFLLDDFTHKQVEFLTQPTSLKKNTILYTWNPNDPCFEWKFGLLLEASNPQKRGPNRFPGITIKLGW